MLCMVEPYVDKNAAHIMSVECEFSPPENGTFRSYSANIFLMTKVRLFNKGTALSRPETKSTVFL